MSKRKTYMIKVGGKEYPTIFTKTGVQRFIADPLIEGLLDNGMLDLNEIEYLFLTKKPWSKRRHMEFKMALGYSISGFADLFPYAKIENPFWEEYYVPFTNPKRIAGVKK